MADADRDDFASFVDTSGVRLYRVAYLLTGVSRRRTAP